MTAMALTTGVCVVTLRLPENHSLKGKRQVLKSLLARLHNRFNVSAAEVDDHESWQIASIGIACAANDERHVSRVLASVIDFIRSERLDAEIVEYHTEIVHGP